MPSNTHELTVELFRIQPKLATGLVGVASGIDLTGYTTIREATGSLADTKPATFAADTVFVLGTDAQDEFAVIVEVQLGRDDEKRWTWLAYLANLRAKIKKPVMLLVVCLDRPTARWAAKPITTGHPRLVLTPIVAGPDRLPVITDPQRIAAEPHLALDWQLALSNLQRGLGVAISARRRDPGSWNLIGTLIAVIDDDWVLTDAGPECPERNYVLPQEKFPPHPSFFTGSTRRPPEDPGSQTLAEDAGGALFDACTQGAG